jgi:hypothetical protein
VARIVGATPYSNIYNTLFLCDNTIMAKQKLSPTAKRMKAVRDKLFAMTNDRRKKKAENQRKRRAAKKAGKNISGKDYDHNRKRFVSVKVNRGNGGKGTKAEG